MYHIDTQSIRSRYTHDKIFCIYLGADVDESPVGDYVVHDTFVLLAHDDAAEGDRRGRIALLSSLACRSFKKQRRTHSAAAAAAARTAVFG